MTKVKRVFNGCGNYQFLIKIYQLIKVVTTWKNIMTIGIIKWEDIYSMF